MLNVKLYDRFLSWNITKEGKMKKIVLMLFISTSLFGDSFEEFLQEEVRLVNKELEIVVNTFESGLDIQQYYYVMGKRIELEKILLNWKSYD